MKRYIARCKVGFIIFRVEFIFHSRGNFVVSLLILIFFQTVFFESSNVFFLFFDSMERVFFLNIRK